MSKGRIRREFILKNHPHKIGIDFDIKRMPLRCSICHRFFSCIYALTCLQFEMGEEIGKRHFLLLREKQIIARSERKAGKIFEGFWFPEN